MKGLLLLATAGLSILPLAPSKWTSLEFSSCPANRIRFEADGFHFAVEGSSSPLVWIAEKPESWRKIVVSGKVSGRLDPPRGEPWGEGADDAWLRVNVIESGGRRLNAAQRLVAPAWMKWLDDRAGAKGGGVAGMQSFLLTPAAAHLGKSRTRPEADLIRETLHAVPEADGRFRMEITLDPPVDSVGLWLQSDGDDTGANFEVVVEAIEVERKEPSSE